MVLLPRAPRPLRLLFEGAGAALAAPPEDESTIPVPSSQLPLVPSLSSSHKQRGKGTDRGPGGGSDSYSGSSSSSDSDSGSSRSSDSSGSSTSGYSSSKRDSTSETDVPGGETTSAAAPALPAPGVATASAAANGGRMSDGKATRKEEQPRLNPPTGGIVSKRSPAAVSRDISVSPNSCVLASPVPAAGSQKTAVSPGSIKTPRGEGKSDDLDVVVTNGECYSAERGSKRVTVSDGRHRSESNGRTGGKEGKMDDDGPRREDAKRVVAGPGHGNGNPRVGATEMGKVKEVVPREASRRETVQAEEALEAASAVAVSASSRDKKEKRAVKAGKRNGIARDGDGHGSSRGGNGDIKGVSKVRGRVAMSSSRRSLAEKDGTSKDDSNVFTQGAKVSWGMTSKETGGLEGT